MPGSARVLILMRYGHEEGAANLKNSGVLLRKLYTNFIKATKFFHLQHAGLFISIIYRPGLNTQCMEKNLDMHVCIQNEVHAVCQPQQKRS